MYWRMYAGHNCTNYAAYRMVKAGLPNTRPWSGGGNATYWGTSMKSHHQRHPARRRRRLVEGRGLPRRLRRARGVRREGRLRQRDHRVDGQLERRLLLGQDHHGDQGAGRAASSTSTTCRSPNTAVPKITGTAEGRVHADRLAPAAGASTGSSYAYQWMADGAAISGATTSTLALTNAVKDKAITVRVIASQLGYPNTAAYSAATSAVQPGVITNTDRADHLRGPARRLDADRAAGIVVTGTGDAELPVAGRRPVRRRADRRPRSPSVPT